MRSLVAHDRHARSRTLSQISARSHHAGGGSNEVSEMRSPGSTISYLELLKLASPEAVVVISALLVLALGLVRKRNAAATGVSPANPSIGSAGIRPGISAASCSFVAMFGVIVAITAVCMLPRDANLFGGMLVITPLTSLFKIVCLVLAFFTICLVKSEKWVRHPGEFLA